MFDSQVLAFALVAAALTITPGADTMLVLRSVLREGRAAGLATMWGICAGLFVHAAMSAVGVSVILARSATLFQAVKLAGAAYLVWLGGKSVWEASRGRQASAPDVAERSGPLPLRTVGPGRCVRDGFLCNVLNPKVAVFYLAFLPQFADPAHGSVPLQTFILGLIFVTIALFSDSIYALLAGQLGGWLKQSQTFQRRQRYFSGSVYIALGLATAVSGHKTK